MIDEAGADHEMTAAGGTGILLRATTSVLAAVRHAAAAREAMEAASAAALAAVAAKEVRSAASAVDPIAIAVDSAARGVSVREERVRRAPTHVRRATKRAVWQSGSTHDACPRGNSSPERRACAPENW
jgi:hypothetical protein